MQTGTSGHSSAVLAIDPGPTQSGVVLLDGGRVLRPGVYPNADVRAMLRHSIEYDAVAIELIRSYGMAVGASVFDTCIEIGRFVEIADAGGKPVDLIPRQTVKLDLCGSPRAKDPNVRQALIDLWGGAGAEKKGGALAGVKSHAWAALAVGVTAARTRGWI